MNQPLSFAVVTQGLASRMPELNNIRPTIKDYHGESVPRQLVCIESAKIEQSQFYLKIIKFKSDVAKGKISLDDYQTLFSAINYQVEAE